MSFSYHSYRYLLGSVGAEIKSPLAVELLPRSGPHSLERAIKVEWLNGRKEGCILNELVASVMSRLFR